MQQKLADVATVAEENIVGVHVVKAFAQEPAEQAKFTRRSEAVFQQTLAREPPARDLRAAHLVRAAARAGGRAARGRAHGRARLAHARQLRRVQPLPRHARRCRCARSACGSARRSARPRRASASSRSSTSRRRSPTRPERDAAAARPRRDPLRERLVRVPDPDRPGAARRRPRHRAGQTVALIGHTGSGKTTLTSLVPRFYDVTAGRVHARRRRRARRDARRRCAARSASSRRTRSSSRRSVARTSPSARGDLADDEVERAARAAQAHEFIERLPKGYDTVIGERGITLSGGQRQRIAIARALAVDPRILILDDATASVDATTEAHIRAGPARGDARPDDAHHRAPPLDDRARRRDRRARRRADRRARHARRARARRARSTARSTSTACSSGSSPTRSRRAARWRTWHESPPAPAARSCSERGAEVDDWSWRKTRRRLGLLWRLTLPYRGAHGALGRLAAHRDGHRARAAVPREVRARRRGQRPRRLPPASSSSRSSSPPASRTGA